jgi:hypothetical protein
VPCVFFSSHIYTNQWLCNAELLSGPALSFSEYTSFKCTVKSLFALALKILCGLGYQEYLDITELTFVSDGALSMTYAKG